jgi:hypothetical protein
MKKYILSILVVCIFAIVLGEVVGAADKEKNQVTEINLVNGGSIGYGGGAAQYYPIISVPRLLVLDMPLPKSMDNLFPPKADKPIWLLGMLDQGEFFTSILVDITANDFNNATIDFKKFKAQYENNSKLVPEFRTYFWMYPLYSLEAAINSGDQTRAMTAYANVGQVCENCHLVNMPKVQQKYHWKTLIGKDFSDIRVGNNVSFVQVMQGLEFNSVAIGMNLQKNQIGQAQADFEGYNASFQLLKETCKDCHTTPRMYYVDSSVQGMVDGLGQALIETPINQTKIDALTQGIGMESCFKCHLVHVSGAFAQNR